MLANWLEYFVSFNGVIFVLIASLIGALLALAITNRKAAIQFEKNKSLLAQKNEYMDLLKNSKHLFLVWPANDDSSQIGSPYEVGSKETKALITTQLKLESDFTVSKLIEKLQSHSSKFGTALQELRQNGTSFKMQLRGLEIIGDTNGTKAIIEISPISANNIGNQIPLPIWHTNHEGVLNWGNDAFLRAIEMPNISEAIKANSRLDAKATLDAKAAIKGETIVDNRAINILGARHMMRVFMAPSNDGAIGMAFDLSAENKEHEILKREAKAHVETLNHLNDAVAVFDGAHNLTTYNRTFSQLWGVEESWLDEKPTHEEFLDKLRERSRLPHLGNYLTFKAAELAHYQATSAIADETWTLPDGRIMRVMRQRQPSGGLLILFEDISDKTTLQAQFKTQIDVQSATLDRLNDAVAVFSGDGKLALANKAFEQLWAFDANYLQAKLDFSKIYRHAINAYNDDDFWLDIEARICDPSPDARQETQGQIILRGGKVLNWLTRPLPDGATLLAFADVTAHDRMEAVLREKAEALSEADRLKTAFLEKVSYQLRTPLNTIKGYSELLESGIVGELNPSQKDYTKSVHQASEQLEKMIDDLLDLAVIDAGQAPLDLGDVDICDVLNSTREMAMTKLTDAQVKIEVDCEKDVGLIRADDKRIRQIMANLMNNAMRTTNAGGTIKLAAKRTEDTIRLIVTSPSLVENEPIEFDAFTEGSRRGGMGLVLVKKFIELHGGWVAMKQIAEKK